ncbi:MAG: hypothetical protein ACREBS_08220 [Nitrososphaerales archaeon]
MLFLSDMAVLFSMIQVLPYAPYLGILSGIADIFGGFILLIIGILVIILIVGVLIVLLPAIIVAIIVWFLTGSIFYAGIAFLIVAIISLVAL